ncbi:MAG: heme ABC exporter ATP-binding protein CcmA [Pseudomonadota bacterium]
MLDVRELSCGRGGVALLSGLSLRVAAGEAVILRGPNGSGKTTLLRCLAGLSQALAGQVQVDPEAVVFSGHADGVKATLSVRENLAFWASLYGTGSHEAGLAAMDLAALADRPAQQLSAGQRRRLGLARLAVVGRKLWLLDEPTVSLDARSVGLFADMVRAHLAEGGAAVIATHLGLGLEGRELDVSAFRATEAVAAAADPFGEALT